MFTRRRFLQSNLAGLALPMTPSRSRSATVAAGATGPRPEPAAPAERNFWNDWPRYLTARMNEARERRKKALAALQTPEQVQERQKYLREQIWKLLGGPLEKSPLNPKVAGSIDRDVYRIERVVFESRPRVFVTAHLYVPTRGTGRFPAILSPLGHSENGKLYRNYQYLFQSLARLGYVVLAFDPFGQGERCQYLDPKTGESLYGPTGEHSQAGRPLLLLGGNFAQYRVWDGIRALDYLLSRPEVDPERIGCTGHSGGGTMTMYLAALEPRIQAAVASEGNSEDVSGPDYDPPGAVDDAEQNLVGGLALAPIPIDRTGELIAFAPKPLLVCYTPQDSGTTYSPVLERATREMFEDVRRIYRILGAEDKVGLFASPLPHDQGVFNRQEAYAWFNRWIGNKDAGTEEAEFVAAPARELNCTPTGQVLTSLGGRSVVELNSDRLRALESARAGAATGLTLQTVRGELRQLLNLPAERTPLEPSTLSNNAAKGVVYEEFVFRSEPQVRVPGWLLKPQTATSRPPLVIHLSEHGREGIVEETGIPLALAHKGYAVAGLDLRGTGITTPRYPSAGPLYYHDANFIEERYAWAWLVLGKPILGQRVWDFMRALDYLGTREDLDPTRIRVVGEGSAGLVALCGALLDDRVEALFLNKSPADLASVVKSPQYNLRLAWIASGFLTRFDLPDLVATLAPRPCWGVNLVDAMGKPISVAEMEKRYRTARARYDSTHRSERLLFIVRPDYELQKTAEEWLATA